jgi:L-threonylcarbamoyladenylate synthase
MEFIQLNDENFKKAVQKAAETLAQGGIILYPTDTLYGLGVDAQNTEALGRLRNLKGREKKKPISVIVADVESLAAHAEVHPSALWYAKRYLPGALTLVLPGREHLPKEVMLNDAIGVRIPDDPFALALAVEFGAPYTATSANTSGIPTPATANEIIRQFGTLAPEIDLIIDAGPRASVLGSTVITFREGVPYILRAGALRKEDLGIL